jgi:ADP-ribose pyrophosphatase YjhB (NUDIX family)
MLRNQTLLPPLWEGVAVLCKSADGKSLLMVLQSHPDEEPTWAVPGGSIEPNETSEQAAIREMKEETGFETCAVHPYTIVESTRERGTHRVHYFQADDASGEARVDDPDNLIHQVAWIPTQRLFNLQLSHEDQRHILLTFMEVS